jgi:opacity protein-like surface antigen
MKSQKILKLGLLCSVIFSLFSASAQQAIVPSGGKATGSGGTYTYSIGQLCYSSTTGATGSVNQGVQQPFEIVTLGNDDFPEIQLTMSVYPNPTTSFVNLNIQNDVLENLYYQLFDIKGKQIQYRKITSSETQISMENVAAAIYILHVSDNIKLLKTFKIIKNN